MFSELLALVIGCKTSSPSYQTKVAPPPVFVVPVLDTPPDLAPPLDISSVHEAGLTPLISLCVSPQACTCQTATQKTATEKQRPQNSGSLTIATVSSATAKTAPHTLERLIKTATGSTATMKNGDCPNIERFLSGAVNSFRLLLVSYVLWGLLGQT